MTSTASVNDTQNTLPGSTGTENQPIKPKNTMSQQDFIKVFTKQLQMQDPMKPMDNSTMMQQMASLTQLSATQALESTIQNLNTNLSNGQVFTASQLIGRNVQVPSDVSPLVDNDGLHGSVILDKPTSNVDVKITEPDTGKLIRTLHLGASSSGVLDFTWDGLDEKGIAQKPGGFYKMEATATINGKPIQEITAGSFKVSSVTHDKTSGNVILNVDGLGGVTMDDIIKIQ